MLGNEILTYLSRFAPITEEIKKAISESTFIKAYKKGHVLLKEGQVSNECYFILKGCIRCFSLEDGEEKTIEIYTEAQSVVPTNYGTSHPSEYYLECVEDTILNLGNPEIEKETFEKYPELESLSRMIAEKMLLEQHQSFSRFKASTPEERYLNLVKTRPDLVQRIPLYQIASYLGVKPESLSRIRKRIMDKE